MNDDRIFVAFGKYGSIFEHNGYQFFVTPCCEATATGTDYGVVCRNCYKEVSWAYADVWPAEDGVPDWAL